MRELARHRAPGAVEQVRRVMVAAKYGGRRFWCPICDRRFRKLAPYNGVPSKACPNCGSRHRHWLLGLYLDRELRIRTARLKVLHIAPELGLGRRLRSLPNLDYVSLDLVRSGVDLHADLERLPFPAATFDLVISSHVLEHVADDRAALRELARVTKPSEGRVLTMVPVDSDLEATYEDFSITSPEERKIAFGQHDHVRMFGRDVAERFGESGLLISEIDYAGSLRAELVDGMPLQPGLDLIYEGRRQHVPAR